MIFYTNVKHVILLLFSVLDRDKYSGHFPHGGIFLSKLKNREEFEGGLKKKRKRGEKKEKKKRVLKHTLKYLLKLKYRKKINKNREEF